jgi:hypothetical protein
MLKHLAGAATIALVITTALAEKTDQIYGSRFYRYPSDPRGMRWRRVTQLPFIEGKAPYLLGMLTLTHEALTNIKRSYRVVLILRPMMVAL